ncbi:MAG: hypothetical protein EOO02_05530 [Chitinophagaceae bacterium]|nr:MAG: hypothetical protein EOO02_05530 [Chitinophagaceae bacterium]
MRKFTTVVVIIIVCCNQLFAQGVTEAALLEKFEAATEDSIRADLLIDLHNATFKTELSKSEDYARKLVSLGEKNNAPMRTRFGYVGLARIERKRVNYDKVISYDKLALEQSVKAKSSIGEIVDNLQIIRDYVDWQKPQNAYPYLLVTEKLAASETDSALFARIANSRGWYFASVHQHTKAIDEYKKAARIYTGLKNEQQATESGYLMALSMVETRNIDEVPELVFQLLESYKSRNSFSRMADCYGILGQCYLLNGNSKKGIENYLSAAKIHHDTGNYGREGLARIDIARCYLILKDLSSARSHADEAKKIFTENNYAPGGIAVKTLDAQFASYSGDEKVADELFVQAGRMATAFNQSELRSENDRYWAEHKYRIKNTKLADSLMLSYAKQVTDSKQPDVMRKELQELINKNPGIDSVTLKTLQLLYTKGGPDLIKKTLGANSLSELAGGERIFAINPFSLGTPAYDSSIVMADNKKLLELETKYKTKLIDDSLRIEKQNLLVEKANSKRKDAILISAFMVAALLAGGFYMQYKFRKRADRDRAKIELLQNEIHHRIKNNLGVIRRLVDVAGKGNGDKISLLSLQSRVSAIEVLHRHLYKKQTTGNIALQDYLKELSSFVQNTFDIDNNNINIKVDAPIDISSGVAEKIGLITNELITNSMKYAFPGNGRGHININASKLGAENRYRLVVADDGVGFAPGQKSNYGMKLIAGLSREIRGEYSFEADKGTVFTIEFSDQKN